jgi:3-dehydroquinate dehydratase II
VWRDVPRLWRVAASWDVHSGVVHVAVLNGVNLGMLGKRAPEIYGTLTLSELDSQVYVWARDLGLTARCVQTDDEGEYVEAIHDAYGAAAGVVVNPGAWTHYSYAVHDALEILTVPIVEVHLSAVSQREEWRRHSVIADLAAHRIEGQGAGGYHEALRFLAGVIDGAGAR